MNEDDRSRADELSALRHGTPVIAVGRTGEGHSTGDGANIGCMERDSRCASWREAWRPVLSRALEHEQAELGSAVGKRSYKSNNRYDKHPSGRPLHSMRVSTALKRATALDRRRHLLYGRPNIGMIVLLLRTGVPERNHR
jgi:hypothetical protein